MVTSDLSASEESSRRRGAEALAHIIFLFGAVIKQSACHCSKVNRLTFKYTVVSGAPPALRDASSVQEKTHQHLHICFLNPSSPTLQLPGSLFNPHPPLIMNQEILFLKYRRGF